MVRFLVTGSRGQLGHAVCALLESRGVDAVGLGSRDLPVHDEKAVAEQFARHRPSHVLHCGAMTNVDGCESEPELAMDINGAGTAHVARACLEHGAALCYVSTDYVFDGRGTRPYRHDDACQPVSAYGRSKLAGEVAVLSHGRPDFYVARTAWVFGPGGQNFPRAILNRARQGGPLKVVDDQRGCPSMTLDLAEAMVDLLQSGADGGVYHLANEGECTWHQFAVELLQAEGLDLEVGRMSSAELDRPAPRPAYSLLDTSRLQAVRGRPLPHYLDAMRRYLEADPT